MKLREITKQLITLLEEKSGCPVHVMENTNLSTMSEIKIARGNLPAHIISYKPVSKIEAPDYAIIFQCALAIRLFDCPPDDRRLIGISPSGSESLEAILTRPNGIAEKHQLSDANLVSFTDQLLHGLITHLRSVPLGLRISEKLSLDHPELLDLESKQVEKELRLNKESLTESIREVMPQEVFDPTQSINAAFATFWAGRIERSEKEDIRNSPSYFETRKHNMDYAHLRRQGYPIGSGTVECGINTVVHHRMKRQGRGWKRQHAQAMLAALGELHSDRFQTAWQATC